MAYAASLIDRQPMSEINTTPLIDVMLVLLIMFVITIPAANHSLEVPLPSEQGPPPPLPILERNQIVLTAQGRVLWNDSEVTLAQLSGQLELAASRPVEPELRFQPDGQASYGLSAEVLRRIKASRVTAFGFVGNEQFADFGKAPARR